MSINQTLQSLLDLVRMQSEEYLELEEESEKIVEELQKKEEEEEMKEREWKKKEEKWKRELSESGGMNSSLNE